jgi:hypothetical protein
MIRNVGQSGIVQLPSSGSTKVATTINNVEVKNAGLGGVAIINGGKATITNSTFTGGIIGIASEGAGTEISADNVTVANNTTGFSTANGGIVRLSNSNVSFNGTGISGTVNSFTNNRFVSNGAGGTLTAIGGPSTPTGQQ